MLVIAIPPKTPPELAMTVSIVLGCDDAYAAAEGKW